jgi:hypothetical protein
MVMSSAGWAMGCSMCGLMMRAAVTVKRLQRVRNSRIVHRGEGAEWKSRM